MNENQKEPLVEGQLQKLAEYVHLYIISKEILYRLITHMES